MQPQLAGDSPVQHARDSPSVNQQIETLQPPYRTLGNDEVLLHQLERHVAKRLAAFHRYEREE